MSKSIKYSGSRFSSSSSDDGDYAGDKIFKKVEDLDIDPNESTPQTINALKKRIKELKEHAEELRLNLEARKRLVKEHNEKKSKLVEEIRKLQEQLAKVREQRKALQDEVNTFRKTPAYEQYEEKIKKLDEIKKTIKKETDEFEKKLLERQKAGKLVDDYDLFLIQNEKKKLGFK